MPAIGRREVIRGQGPGVGHGEDTLQPLDFVYGLLGIHPISICNRKAGRSIRNRVSSKRKEWVRAQMDDQRRLGGEDVLIQKIIAEFSPRVIFLGEFDEVRHLSVNTFQYSGRCSEEFSPVGTGAEGRQFFFDDRE